MCASSVPYFIVTPYILDHLFTHPLGWDHTCGSIRARLAVVIITRYELVRLLHSLLIGIELNTSIVLNLMWTH